MKLEVIDNLNSSFIKQVDEFLFESDSIFNPLFSSSKYAIEIEKLGVKNFKYYVVRDTNNSILAIHLVFYSYRGDTIIRNKSKYLINIISPIARMIFPKISWENFIVFKKDIDIERKEKIKELIYSKLNGKKIRFSPIYDSDIKFFDNYKIGKWGTYILDFSNKTYEEIYKSLKRQARKSIEKAKNDGIEIKTVNSLDELYKWKKEVRELNIDIPDGLESWFINLRKEKSYIFEIFTGYKNDIFLGSLIIYGFNNFVTEITSISSNYAKKNKLYVQDMIKDEIIKYCLYNKIRYYDLAGFNPNENATNKEEFIKRFKKKFNGKEIIYNCIME